MLYGYTGKILHVDLSAGSFDIEEPDEDLYRTYMGGSALGLYYLLKHTPVGADPLGPENTLVFALAGATGAPVSGQSRCTVVARSPLTNAVGDSQAGGFWPAELKFAGFDALVIHGRAAHPVYLWIKDDRYELRDARHLWGLTTSLGQDRLVEELGDQRIEVAQVGPAGEKLVRFAAIMNMRNRAHGRTGMGAVMGSKNLKAIAVRGTRKSIPLADQKAIIKMAKGAAAAIPDDFEISGTAKYGTAEIVPVQDVVGGLPTRNYQSGHFGAEESQAISGERMYDELLRGADRGEQDRFGRDTCYACAVRCKRVIEGEWKGHRLNPQSGGPEYETLATFGSYCAIDDLHAVAYANQLCNEYGVDTISAGATMAFAIECFENGLIDTEDTGGVELRWGGAEAMVAMLEKTLTREGFGDVLAEGSARAAAHIGKGASEFLITVKNQEIPAHMPHVKGSLSVICAVNPFGADHQSSEHDTSYTAEAFEGKYRQRLSDIGLTDPQPPRVLNEEKMHFALYTQYVYSAIDTVNVCQFVYGPGWQLLGLRELAEMLTAVTGWDVTIEELLQVGARRLNLLRAYNAREGITRERDTLPRRFFNRPLAGGASDGYVIDSADFENALDIYYRLAGWDASSGIPTRDTLVALDLAWVADQLDLPERV